MADNTDAERKYRAPALEKGLDLLELLAAQAAPLTPSQMSTELGRSLSELFRMIQVLEFRGYIEQTPDGYRLTNRLFTLGMTQAPVRSVSEAALPVMRELAASTGQSCHLVVPTDDQIVVIARVESPGDLGYSVRVGYRRPMIEATSGLLFYGAASPARQAELRLRLSDRHPKARLDRYIRAAKVTGDQGYAERESDFVKGVTDLVAPIMGADGIIATLITPFIEQHPNVCYRAVALDLLRASAREISDMMSASVQA